LPVTGLLLIVSDGLPERAVRQTFVFRTNGIVSSSDGGHPGHNKAILAFPKRRMSRQNGFNLKGKGRRMHISQ
jgi:hypothetical protein